MRSLIDGRRSAFLLLAVVIALVLLPSAWLPSAAAATFTVTKTDDDGSPGTLRWAILQANANPGSAIIFQISPEPQAIVPTRALPAVTATTDIDGGQLGLIQLFGGRAGAHADGLAFAGAGAAGSTVRNLVINFFGGAGILIVQSFFISVSGNVIGTEFTCTSNFGNGWGVLLDASSENFIGGSRPGDGNLICGNRLGGVLLANFSDDNLVIGNFIGTDSAGNATLGNGQFGSGVVICCGSGGNRIGMPDFRRPVGKPMPNAAVQVVHERNGNVIAGHHGFGVDVRETVFDLPGRRFLAKRDVCCNFIQNNRIHDNVASGVNISGPFFIHGNWVGGLTQSEGNTIFRNGQAGVVINGIASGNPILSNSISSNVFLGIDLGDDGVTPNDFRGQTGPNDFQNFPVLTAAFNFKSKTTILGTLSAEANQAYLIQFFSNSFCDRSGFGEGGTLIASQRVLTGNNGQASLQAVAQPAVEEGRPVTATATQASLDVKFFGSTSEFSECEAVTSGCPNNFECP